ncbi:MAG TPA: Gfo/Idh/MocA family oxidoreductase [Gemmatimonadales bacterium]|nr:Gfo/Idh/MocA family oxidoreductase [Gemmatimonadales bacterium]
MTIRFGVIGAGIIGTLRAQSIRDNPETALIAVADPKPEHAERAARGTQAKVCQDYRQLLDTPVDAVIVSSPLPDHAEQVTAALSAGKHVLCEKPLGNSTASCRRMLTAAAGTGAHLAVGFNHRYYPCIKFLKRVIDEGRIGILDHLRIFGGHDGLANFRADWQYRAPDSGGGAMMDVGIHMTDLARYLLGDITEVYGIASNNIWKIVGSEDNAIVVLKSPAGIPAVYQATWTEWKGYRFHVEAYGDRGMVRGYYAPMFNLLITQEKPGGPRKRQVKLYPEIILREKLKSWTSTALISFQEELRDFVKLLGGDNRVPLADGVAGLRAVEIADAVYRSTASGKAVSLEAHQSP